MLNINGTVSDGGAGTTSLVRNGGAITETGALIAGTLSGRAANGAADADASLTGANTIVTLAGFSADHFDLADGRSLTVTGPVTASTAATITDTGTLVVSGTIAPASGTTAIAVGLTAGVLNINGTVSDGGAGTTSLVSNGGAITETGALIAGTLSGRAANGAADADASLTGANSIAALAAFSADHFSLTDGRSLTVTGPVIVASAATIVDTGTLLVSGTIAPASGTTASAVGLTAGVLNIAGTVSDGGTGTTSLVSNAGAITETGTLIAGTLSGRAMSGTLAADASLTGSTTIATLGSFTAAAFTLDDATSLTIAGPVVAQTATVSVTGSLLVNGSIGACGIGGDTTLISTGTLTVAAGALIWSLGGTVDLQGGIGFVQTGGLINGQDVVVHAASGDVTLSGGTIAAANVVGVTASTGGISELGGVIAANSTISVLGSTGLDIESGTIISGGSVVLGTDGALTMSGGEVAAGANLTIGGFSGSANSYIGGAFTQSGGTLSAGSTLTVLAIGDLTAAGGIRYAAGLIADSASGTTTIDLTSGGAPITAGPSLVYCGGLCIGTLYPGGGSPSGATVPGPGPGQTLTPVGIPDSITLRGVSIVINQPEVATVVDLIAHGIGATTPGNITETGAGSIIATTLEGEALNGGAVSLLGANAVTSIATFAVVSTIGTVTAPSGSFDLLDVGTISVAGPLTAGNVTVTAGSIEVPGTIVGGTLVALYGTTGITESGTINAGTIAANTGTVTLNTGSIGTIALSGSVGAGTLIALSAGSSGISQTAGLLNAGTLGTLSLAAIGGGVTQAAAGAIITGRLISDPAINSGTIGGSVALLGTANAIGTIGPLAGTGDIQIQDASALTIAPSATVTSTSGNIYIESSHSLGITFGANSTLAALAANATIGLQADRLTNLGTTGATGVVSTNGGTFELAPNTAGNLVALGTTLSTGLSLATLDGIAAARVRIGAATLPGSTEVTIRAGTINAGGTFDAKGTFVLELDATGDVGQTAPLVNVGTLTGSAGSFTLTNTLNTIGTIGLGSGGTLGSLDATGTIIVNNGTDLTIAGLIHAGGDTTISLPGTLMLNGEVTSPAGNTWLDAGAIVISQPGTLWPIVEALDVAKLTTTVLAQEAGVINAGTVTIAATGSAALNDGLIVATAGTVGITSPAVSVGGTETIAAVNSATAVSFSGNVTQANSYIGSNGSVTVGGTLTEQNGGTLLAIGNVSLGGLSQSGGVVNAGAGLAVGSGSSTAGWAGSSAASGSFYQSGGTAAATGNVNIFTSGTFLQTGGVLASGGTLGVTAFNGITVGATVSAAGTPSGFFMLLANGGDALLTTTGLLAGPATIAHGDTIAGNALQAPAGTVLIAGTAGTRAFGQAGAVGNAGSRSNGYVLGTSTLVTPLSILSVGSAVTGGAVIPAVLIGRAVDIDRPVATTTLGLYAETSVVEGATGAIAAGTVTGSAGVSASGSLAAGLIALGWTNVGTASIGWAGGTAGSATLTPGGTINTIGTLSDFVATGDFSLTDGQDLRQIGSLAAGAGTLPSGNTTTIDVIGALTVDGLIATSAGNTYLSSSGDLTVSTSGIVLANAGTVALSSGSAAAIILSGSVLAGSLVALSGGTGGIRQTAGTIDAHTGTLAVRDPGGAISQTGGTIIAGTLIGNGTITDGLSFTASNTIGTIGSLTVASGDFVLFDTGTVSVADRLSANNVTLTAGSIAVPGSIIATSTLVSLYGTTGIDASGLVAASAGTVSLATGGSGAITLEGSVGAGSLVVLSGGSGGIRQAAGTIDAHTGTLAVSDPGGAIMQTGGTIIAGTLIGNGVVTNGLSFTASNTIGTIGSLTVASGDFVLFDTGAVSVAGPLSADNVTLTAGSVAVPGSIIGSNTLISLYGTTGIDASGLVAAGAGTVSLATGGSGAITLEGSVGAGSLVVLSGGSGGIRQTAGTIDAHTGTLAVSDPGGAITQTGGTIIADTLIGDGVVTNGLSLTVSNTIGTIGSLNVASGDFVLFDTGTVSVADRLTANNVTLTAGSIDVPGSIIASNTQVSLYGTIGIDERGLVAANGGTVSLSTGGSGAIALEGSVGAGSLVVLSGGSGGIRQTAGTIDAHTGTLAVSDAGGAIMQTGGTIIAGTLIGNGVVTNGLSLTASNTIATIGSLTIASGDFVLADTGTVSVTGSVSADNVTLTAGSIDVASTGTISATSSQISLLGTSGIAESGVLSAADVTLSTGSAGGIALSGNIDALSLIASAGSGGISQTAGELIAAAAKTLSLSTQGGGVTQSGGTIFARNLVSDTGITGTVSLLGSNTIIAVGNLAVTSGDFTLADATAVSLTGPLTANNVTITAPAITASGVIDAPRGAVSLNASSTLAQTSGAITGGSVSLTAPAAALSNGSIVATTGTVGISATTATVSAAEIIAALNTATGVVFTGNVTQAASSYIGSNGSVAVTGLLSENGGSLLAAGNVALGSLAQTGGTIAAGTSLTIGSSGSFSQSGGLLASTGNADIAAAGAFTQTGGVLATGGTLGVTAGNGIDIAGTVSAAGPATGFTLLAAGGDAVLETTGLLAGAALNVPGDSIPGNALLAPSGTVRIAGTSGTQGFAQAGAVGGIAAVSGYAVSQPASPPAALHLSAPTVAAPSATAVPVKLSGAAIDLQRPITAGTLGLYAAGGITQGANAVINASRLTGSSGADVNLLQANVIGTLGAFGDNGHAFHLVDSSNLMLAGLLTANSVWIEDVSYTIDLIAGSAFAGLGAGSSNPLKADPFPAPGAPGVYLTAANFAVAQNPAISTGSVVNWTFALTGSGNVDLGVFRQPEVKLFLKLDAGTASGALYVAGLQVAFTTATTKTINLIGSVGGVSGQNAASGAHIAPQHKNNYQINGCPISSVNCVQFTSLTVPVTNPLRDVQLGFMEYQGDADSVLPDVADRDY
nr:hypothetical protein [uncultured Rhodopila sp.]